MLREKLGYLPLSEGEIASIKAEKFKAKKVARLLLSRLREKKIASTIREKVNHKRAKLLSRATKKGKREASGPSSC